MVTLKKTWIDGYSGGRLVSLKDYCNGKAHMKGLGSFKLSEAFTNFELFKNVPNRGQISPQ